jgi:D-alanyl-D-alanine endopeptidase (penicillin-binding protein 7)
MIQQPRIRAAALIVGSILLVEGSALTEARAEAIPPLPPAPAGASPGPVSAPGASLGAGAGEVLLAAAPTTTKKRRKRTRTRKRRKPAPLRLPAVTPYGIPRLHVKAAYVVDATNNRVLFTKNPERVLPIASLTKLVTAMVFLETDPDWDRVIEMLPEDIRNSSKTRIRAREEITVRDLFHMSLMSSDNAATKALVRTCGVPYIDFIARMNGLADSLGLAGTHFVEPTGLSERNVSTAQDMAKILNHATNSEVIGAITQKTEYKFVSNKKLHQLVNTNRLLRGSQWTVTGGKTGFIREAGYCLVTNVKGPEGADITAVVLGAPSNALRFAEARRILDWTFRFGLNRTETLETD